jgi:uncharacterized membrane protein YeiH
VNLPGIHFDAETLGTLQTVLEHFGVAVGAISGVLAARGKQVDLFGVVVLAIVTAFGGGTVRDLLLGAPVFWIGNPSYLHNAATTALVTFVAARFYVFPEAVLQVADAFVLALFTMVGAHKAGAFGAGPAITVTMGIITGVVGGVLRDVLTGEIPLVFRRRIYLYATAALCGGLAFVGLNHFWPANSHTNVIAGVVVTLSLRLAAIRWRLSLPEFEHKDDEPPQPPAQS